ncbi:MAG: C45 family peptidase [bacterium]
MLLKKPALVFLLFFFFSITLLLPVVAAELKFVSEYEGGKLYKADKINVIVLRGNYREMGRQEGMLLKDQLAQMYKVSIEEIYIKKLGVKLTDITALSRMIFALYPKRFQDIIYGMAETSGLELDQLLALDQLNVLPMVAETAVHCSAIVAWGEYTGGGPLVFGRNFDYPEYYEKFNPYLTLVVYQPDDAVPTAVIGYPGGVSAMHGLNKEGLFLELNDGTASGGTESVDNRIPPLLFVTSFLFDSSNLVQLNAALNTIRVGVAGILTAADRNTAFAYECSINDTKKRLPDKDGLLVETNHFVNPAWKMAPTEGGETRSYTRYKNLLALGDKHKGKVNAQVMRQILDTNINQGGATRPNIAIQQLVVVPAELKIWIKALGNPTWTELDLRPLLENK